VKLKSVLITILALICAPQVQSEEIAEGVYELGEIVVSASRLEAESTGTLRTVTAEDIIHSGARTLDEAIDLLPGVYVRMAAAGTPRIDIRGFRTRHVTLLLDGIPINDTFDGQFDPTILPVENIAKIKLTTGGGSVLYGSGGNGGIINIITKNGVQKIQGTINTEISQSDTYLGKLTFSSASDQWNIFVSGSPSKRDGYPLSDDFATTKDEDGDTRDNSDRKRNNLFASFSYKPSDRALYGLTFNYVQGENGVPAVVNYDKNDTFTKKPKYDRMNDLEGYSAQWATRYTFDQPFTFRSWAYFNQLKTTEDRYDTASYSTQAKNGASHAESTTQVVGANTQMQYVSESQGVVTLGLSLENNTWNTDGFSIDKKTKATLLMKIRICKFTTQHCNTISLPNPNWASWAASAITIKTARATVTVMSPIL
jgi:vitamin B12 transporter